MALGAQVVDFVGLKIMEKVHHLPRHGQVSVVEKQFRPGVVKIPVKVVDPVGVESARTADQAVYLVPLVQKELGKVGSVLAGDSRDKGLFHDLFPLLPELSRLSPPDRRRMTFPLPLGAINFNRILFSRGAERGSGHLRFFLKHAFACRDFRSDTAFKDG